MVKLGGGEPRVTSHQPHLSLLYGTALREPTSRVGLGVPDQDASQGPSWLLGQLVEINPTFSPLISLYTFKLLNLNLTLYFSLLALLSVIISLQIDM